MEDILVGVSVYLMYYVVPHYFTPSLHSFSQVNSGISGQNNFQLQIITKWQLLK